MRPYLSAMLIACVLSVPMHAAPPTVSAEVTLDIEGGESQSTVVPPKIKSQCLAGRLLVTNDHIHPPTAGFITGRNLDDPNGKDVIAKFTMPADMTDYLLDGTPDADLITLSNGNVLYVTAAWKKSPINTPWASNTKRNGWGPNARSNVMVWRSTDCGEKFEFRGELDTVSIDDGSCAMPQMEDGGAVTGPWNMGGTDGQLVNYDPKTNRLYMTHRCVGLNAATTTPYALDPKKPLNKMLIAESTDEGKNWTTGGFTTNQVTDWRVGVIPYGDNQKIVLGYRDGFVFAKRVNGKFVNGQPQANGGNYGWTISTPSDDPYMKANVWAHTLLGRTPGTKDGFFIVYPSALGVRGQGFRVAFYDPAKAALAGTPLEIAPQENGTANFLFHPVLIDHGTTAPLLYWTEVIPQFMATTKKATVRGCFILGSQQAGTVFTISQEFKVPKTHYWFGDYESAAAFTTYKGMMATSAYYPMWPEPDGTLHFARVERTAPIEVTAGKPEIDPNALKKTKPPFLKP